MTYFAKSVAEMKNAADIVYPYSGNPYYIENAAKFTLRQWCWRSVVSGVDQADPFAVFEENRAVSAKDYFEGLIKVKR